MKKPVLLAILDGVAIREEMHGNAVLQAKKPSFDYYLSHYPHCLLEASGKVVGLPEGQMGNSEVGHLNIGAGRVVYQDLTRITKEIEEGFFYTNKHLLEAIQHCKEHGSDLHLCGLLSDGGVHSHMDHLLHLIELCVKEEMTDVYLHLFLDGRDVSPRSAPEYIKRLLEKIKEVQCGKIVTIQGRYYAMDRDRRWDRTEKAYRAMVYGEGMIFDDPLEAIQLSYTKGIDDEFMLPVVIREKHEKPEGIMKSDDALIFFNFRPDRAIQLSFALTKDTFNGFDRGSIFPKGLYFVSFTHYSEELSGKIAFEKPHLKKTLGEVVSEKGYKQLRIAETEKYPHVTYFMNGGRKDPFLGEDRILINSPKVATYDLKPEMSAYEVTDSLLNEIEKKTHDLIILNFANPDMVGHSGRLHPTIRAVEVVDECLGRIITALHEQGGCAIITADHGNADMVLDQDNQPVTSHTTFPVPCIVTDRDVLLRSKGILADIAPTILQLMGVEVPKEMTGKSLLQQ